MQIASDAAVLFPRLIATNNAKSRSLENRATYLTLFEAAKLN